MRYPKPLKKGDTIGICAPSSGVYGAIVERFDNAVKNLDALGYTCKETPSVRKNHKLASSDSRTRAEEFMSLYRDPAINAIIPPWGGVFLMDILPYIDFEELAALPPKWVLGFSDTSILLFLLSHKYGVASAHGPNLLDFGPNPIDSSVLTALDALDGRNCFQQTSLEKYQKEWGEITAPYNLTEKVEWKALNFKEERSFSGRLIGGNLDVICKLIGTPFESIKEFINQYSGDGIIWYFESCEMNTADIYTTLWQMKMNGWFKHSSGFLIGRPEGCEDVGDFTFADSLSYPLADLNVPVIYDCDIGHLPPQITLINGALASVAFKNGRCSIVQKMV